MSTTTFTPATSAARVNSSSGVAGTAWATVAATAGNTIVWAVGRIGKPIEVIIGADAAPEPLAWSHVAITTIVATVLGGIVFVVMRRRHAERLWAIGAVTLAVVSAMPLWRLDIDASSKTLLSLMHLLTGLCCVAVQLARRGRR
jgi:hypothetical protein